MLDSSVYPRFLLRLTHLALIIFNWSCMSWTQDKWNPKESQQFARLFPGSSQTVRGSTINLQGLSGLAFDHETEHKLFFWTLTDRGPSRPRVNDGNQMEQVFLEPKYQPRIYQFSIDKNSGTSKIEKTIMLKDGTGTALTGLPPCDRSQIEIKPIDALGLPLKCSSLGIDPESITRDRDGNFWLGEEYRPAIMKFSPEGKLIKTYVPTKSTGDATAIAGVVNPARLTHQIEEQRRPLFLVCRQLVSWQDQRVRVVEVIVFSVEDPVPPAHDLPLFEAAQRDHAVTVNGRTHHL